MGRERRGRLMFNSGWRPGMEEMVDEVKDVQGRI